MGQMNVYGRVAQLQINIGNTKKKNVCVCVSNGGYTVYLTML